MATSALLAPATAPDPSFAAASEDKLATVGLSGKVDDINRSAVAVARKMADEGGALVAGNLSLTWVYEPDDRNSHERIRGL